jgi:hypothetical protein
LPIRFRLDDRPESVRFSLAPAAEAIMSLHVLLFPKIHAVQHPWIRAMQRTSPQLKREIRAFAFLYVDAFPDCFTPTSPDETFESQLETIRSLSDAEAAHELARPLFFYWEPSAGGPERLTDPAVRDRAIMFARETAGEAGAELCAAAFDDPGTLRDRLVALLERYWEEAFAREWSRFEPALRAAVDESERLVGAHGPLAFLESVPDLRREGDTIVRRSGHEHLVEVSPDNPLLLVPSAYVWPHVRVNCDPPWPIVVLYARRSSSARQPATPCPRRSSRCCAPRATRRACASSSWSASAPPDRGARAAREPERAGALTAAADPPRGRARAPAPARLLRALRPGARGARGDARDAGRVPQRIGEKRISVTVSVPMTSRL